MNVDKSVVFRQKKQLSGTYHFARDLHSRITESVCGQVVTQQPVLRVISDLTAICGRCKSLTDCKHKNTRCATLTQRGMDIDIEWCEDCGEEVD